MKSFKKNVAGIMATTAALMLSALSPLASASAATTSVLLGDANGDGKVTIADATCIYQYLGGSYAASQYCFTAMDVNEDCVVNDTDGYIIQYMEATGTTSNAKTVNKELYTLPDNSTRTYRKYNCSTKKTTSYTLAPLTTISEIAEFDGIDLQQVSPDDEDFENTNVVQLVDNNGNIIGSGFVINGNVIATAASCVYNNGFKENITVNVCDVDGTIVEASFKAKSYHIPQLYINASSDKKGNYDYALICVDNITVNGKSKNLLDYTNAFSIGVAAEEFMYTGRNVTASGFSKNTRYFSTGKVFDYSSDDNEEHNDLNLRINIAADCKDGKSGGVMYYNSSYKSNACKSAIAITTGGDTKEAGTWGVRMNPTLIHFYFRNPNI